MAAVSPITVPDGYSLHTENTSHILLPSSNGAFLNPVQEFNRDMSVACIRVWSEELNKQMESKWRRKQEQKAKKSSTSDAVGPEQKRARKGEESADSTADTESKPGESHQEALAGPSTSKNTTDSNLKEYRPHSIVLLEALSATGLRSIRYAKEIPLVKYVIANDLSPSAVEVMNRNVEINGLGPEKQNSEHQDPHGDKTVKKVPKERLLGKVRVNEGDACALMYNHRVEKNRVDVVDLDPYGTAAPFIDASVQCVRDGGLLCVTCTDLSVLATNNYPEKCFSNYGGIPVKAEYCHEAALRLVLHTISTSASRYGRFIQPLLSLSIDFYVRLFIKIQSAPIEVKKAANKTSIFYVCSSCQSFYDQPLSRITEQVHEKSGHVNLLFKTHTGPTVPERCPECNSALHIAGPMWSGPIHDTDFVGSVINHLEANADNYGTAARMKGMLSVAKEELAAPFYFTPAKIASFFHCICPSLDDTASALLHAGHGVSRSHACPGSLKTNATRQDIHDIFRSWVKLHPVKQENISNTSIAHRLLEKEPRSEANFTRHPLSVTASSKVKLVRYQQNPSSHWGPGTKANSGTKRKREAES